MLALVLAVQLATATSASPPATATIRGHVSGTDTNQPLRKAQVRLLQVDIQPGPNAPQSRENRLATTDADGKYEFKDLPAGRYNLTASKGSYVSISWGQQQPNEPGKPLDVHEGETIERVDFTLPHGSVITGRIVDEFGEPLSNVMVAAVRSQVINGQRRMVPSGRSVQTDDMGEFRLFGVPPGQYYVQATWRRVGPPMLDSFSPDRTGYPVTFFPGTTDVTSAQRFTIGIGDLVTDLAMALSPLHRATVNGTVVDTDGRPAGGIGLMVVQRNGNGFSTFGNMVRPDGTFSYPLSPGEYTLRTTPTAGRKDVGTVTLTVGSEDISDVHIVMSPPATIAGRIVVDPAQAQSLPPGLMLMALPFVAGPMPGNAPARVADDLSFELTAPLSGRVRLNINNLPPAWTIHSVRINSIDVIDEGIELKPNQNISDVEVELTNQLTSVMGTVSASNGDAAKNYTVVFFPTDEKRWNPGSRYLRTARPDQDGRFQISGLPPAEYNVIAVERLDQGQNTDPEYLEQISSRAVRFTLTDRETKTLDLKLDTTRR
jgi:hypothetical protein